jgi:hypothetical protein
MLPVRPLATHQGHPGSGDHLPPDPGPPFTHVWEIFDARTEMCGASSARFPGQRYVVFGVCLHDRWGVVCQTEEGFRTRERAQRAIAGRLGRAQEAVAERVAAALEAAQK